MRLKMEPKPGKLLPNLVPALFLCSVMLGAAAASAGVVEVRLPDLTVEARLPDSAAEALVPDSNGAARAPDSTVAAAAAAAAATSSASADLDADAPRARVCHRWTAALRTILVGVVFDLASHNLPFIAFSVKSCRSFWYLERVLETFRSMFLLQDDFFLETSAMV